METPQIIKAAALVLDQKGRLLIVKSKKKDVWMSLGGKPESGETMEECLKREILEEVGLTMTSAKLFVENPVEIAAGTVDLTVKIYFYLVTVAGEIQLNPEDNINEYKWISRADFEEIKSGKTIKIGSGLEFYAIPKLISELLLQ